MALSTPCHKWVYMTIGGLCERCPNCPPYGWEELINSLELQAHRCVDIASKPKDGTRCIVKNKGPLHCIVGPDQGRKRWQDAEQRIIYDNIPECGPNYNYYELYFLKKDVVKIEQEHPDYLTSPPANDEKSKLQS